MMHRSNLRFRSTRSCARGDGGSAAVLLSWVWRAPSIAALLMLVAKDAVVQNQRPSGTATWPPQALRARWSQGCIASALPGAK
jgi:hypothetical protein